MAVPQSTMRTKLMVIFPRNEIFFRGPIIYRPYIVPLGGICRRLPVLLRRVGAAEEPLYFHEQARGIERFG